jgi:hypothetical protein|tara:strand:- start:1825 stop:2274 length:450 start_codon:yes stop_codon:yes gene_type:complete
MGLFKDCGCGCNGRKQEEKLIISIISGLIFFIVANPETFRIVRAILGSWISTPTGCPSTLGLLVHTLVFILVVWGMMNIKKEGGGKKKKGGCGCGDGAKKGTKVIVAPPAPMEEAPDPRPEFAERTIEVVDSGRMLEPAPVDSEGTLFK